MAIRRTGSQTLVNRGVTAAAATPVNIITGSSGGGATVNISSIQIANSTFVAKDDLAIDTAGGYMIINGTGFQSGAVVYIQGTAATSTSFVSSSRLNVTVPALSSGLLDVYVVNTDGSGSIYLRSLNANGTPSWTTTSPLTSQDTDAAFAINLVASGAAGDGTITYAVSAGSTLPSGTFLASNGYFYGTITGLAQETTYSFSVDAIDAQNQETARSFNITVRSGDSNFKDTVLLLNGETSNNTWITDSSTNNFAITVNGDTRPTAFSPYETVWSNFFDGDGDFLNIAANAAFDLSTSDFTVELWINIPSTNVFKGIWGVGNASQSGIGLQLSNNGTITLVYGNGSAAGFTAGSTVVQLNKWNHLAVSRIGSTTRFYINGILETTITLSNFGAGSYLCYVGDGWGISGGNLTAGSPMLGYISNFRIIKGTALYTSNFTPSTSPLTAIANTVLLTCQSNRLIDNSTNNFTVTRNGNVTVINFGPFTETDITTGSGYFDGTGDFLSTPSNAAFNCGTGDFTLEFWFYDNGTSTLYPSIFSSTNWTEGVGGVSIRYNNTGHANKFLVAKYGGNGTPNGGSGTNELMRTTNTYPSRTWHHVAFTRSGNIFRIFVNGVLDGQTTSTESIDWNLNSAGAKIGGGNWDGANSNITGYISNLQLVKGTAVYTTNFTPPTSALTAIANTSLLTLQSRIGENNNRIVDLSGLNTPISRNGNLTQGTFSPYQRGGWSNYFDGTGDDLTIPSNSAFTYGTGDFTVEMWVFVTANPGSYAYIYGQGPNTTASISLYIQGGVFRVWNGSAVIVGSTSYSLNTWYHVAISRSGTSLRLFLNGVQDGSATNSGNITTGSSFGASIGRWSEINDPGYFTGYISNLRILKGTALYTSTFTPPTLPLTAVANTSLLTCADNGFIDDSPNNFTITRNGNVSVQPFSPFKVHTYTPITNSVYFDGTGDYLQSTLPTALGTSDFTFEAWVYSTNTSGGGNESIFSVNGTSGFYIQFYTTIVRLWYAGLGSSFIQYDLTPAYPINRWYHVAATKTGSTIRLFLDGTLRATGTGSTNLTTTTALIGALSGGVSDLWKGYISNLRLIIGTSLYTSSFTPSTTPLTAVANTSLLTCQSSTIIDNSINNSAITVNGDARATVINPLGFTVTNVSGPSADYSITNDGGSMYFDGNGDFLKLDTTNILTWSGTTTFTVEGWFYQTAFDATSGFMNNVIGDLTPNSSFGDALYWSIGMNNSNQPGIRWYGGPTTCNASEALTLYRWNHVAWVVSAGVLSIYINGRKATLSGTSTLTAAAASMNYVVVGADRGKYYSGYMSGLRVVKGTALYTSGFVPSAAPPTPIGGSTLLINGTNGSIIDYTRKNNLETVGDVKIRNNIKKYGNTSIFFDGTGDYLSAPSSAINDLSGDFTIEAWIYRSITTTHSIVNIGDYNGASGILFYVTNGNALAIYTNNSLAMSGGTVPATTWTHVALVRSGTGSGNLKLYLNGTNVGTPVTNNTTFSGRLYVGIDFYNGSLATNFMNGYIDDLRITKGVARYTSNFTAPAGPFQTN